MKMRKIIFSILFAVIAFIFMGKEDALAKVYNDFAYSINDDNYACFTSYWGEDENVVIPSEVVINEVTYPVVIGAFDAGDCCNLSFETGVKFTDKTSFKDNTILESIDLTGVNTSEVTQMKDYFLNCYKLSSVKFGNIDTSNVVDMHSMFYFCNNLKSISLNGLNTSNVTDISYMFSYCLNLNDLDLSNCDFSSVTKKDGFISNCFLLNTIKTPVNISSEQIIALPTDSQLIYTDDNGNNYYSLPKGDDGLVSKNLSAQRNGELNNYSYTISDNNIYITAYYGDGGDFKVPSTLEVDGVSYNVVLKSQCKFINVKKLSFEKGVVINAYIIGNILEEIDFNDAVNGSSDADLIQNNAVLKKVTFGNYNLTNAGILDKTNIELFASGCYELEEIDFSNVDTSNLTDITWAFNDCKSLETINFSGCDFSNLDVYLNNSVRSGIEKCENLKYIYAPINIPEGLSIKLPHKFVDINGNRYTYLPEKLNESILLYSYENVDDLESIIPDSEWLKNFKYTTSRVTFLTITGYLGTEEDVCIPSTGISKALKRKIYLGENSFSNTGKLSFEDGVIAYDSLAFNDAKFSEIDLTGLDMSSLNTDGTLFNNCENLEKITVPAGFTSGVTINLPCTFKGSDGKYYETIPTGLSKAIVLSNRDGDTTWQEDFTYELDKDSSYIILTKYNGTETEYKIQSEAVIDGVSYTTYIDGLETGKYIHSLSFEPGVKIGDGPAIGDEANLESIDLTNADTSEVINMTGMFMYFSGLKHVNFGNIDTSNVVKFDSMFSGCTSLEDVDFGSIDTSNVISFNSMFYDCVKITDIDVSVLDTSKATDMDHMFMGCTSLQKLDLSGFDMQNCTNSLKYMLKGCTNLGQINTPINISYQLTAVLPDVSPYYYKDETGNIYENLPNGTVSASSMLLTCVKDGELSKYTYTIDSDSGILSIKSYRADSLEDYAVPATLTLNGVTYQTAVADRCNFVNVRNLSFENGVLVYGAIAGSSIKTIDFTGADDKELKGNDFMFKNLSSLESINFGGFDITKNSTSLSMTFYNCSKLKEVDFSNMDTGNITTVYEAFTGCNSLETLNFTGCDLSTIDSSSGFLKLQLNNISTLKYIYTTATGPNYKVFLPGKFVDEDGNLYIYLPKDKSVKLYSVNNAPEAKNYLKEDEEDDASTEASSETSSSNSASTEASDSSNNAASTETSDSSNTSSSAVSNNNTDTTWQNDFEYSNSNEDGIIYLQKYIGSSADEVVIPATAIIDGTTYKSVMQTSFKIDNVKKLSFENGVVADSSLKFINGGFKEVDLTGIDMSALSGDGDIFESCENLEKITVPSGFNAGVSVKLSGTYTGSNGKTYTTIPTGLSSSIVLTKTDNAGTDNSSDAATEATSTETPDDSSTASSTEAASDTEGTSDSSTTGTGSDSGTSSGTTGSGSGADSEDSNNADMSFSEFGSKFVYGISGNTIYLRKYIGPSVDELVIPATVNKNGTIYKVSIPTYCNITNVRKVSFKRGVIIDGNFANSAFEEIDFTGAVVGNSGVTSNALLNNNVRLKKVTWGDFDLSKYTEFENTFAMCLNLKEIDFSRVNTSSVVYFYKAFSYNLSLETLNMSGCDLGNYRTDVFTFWDWGLDTCTSLKNIYAPTNLPADVYVQLPYTFYDAAGNEYKFLPTGLKKSILLVNTKPLNNDSNENNTTEASGTDNTETSSAENGVNTSSSDAGNANNDGSESTNTNPTPTNSDTTEQNVNPDPAPTADNTASTQQTASTTALNAGSKVSVSTGNYVVSDSHNVTYKSSASKNTTKVTIPSTITVNGESYSVTVVSANAFKNCKKLKSVTVPTTVTKINANAFKGCKSLKKIVIKANGNLKVNKKAFMGVSSKTTIVIKGVKGKTKAKLVKQIQKQTKAKVK